MDFLVDKVNYTVSEFFESFGHNLPKIVIVTQGFYGEIVDDTFDKDQVYRLHTTSRQKRVIARATDRHYSIPLNYPLKVCIVKKHGKVGKEQTLKEVVTEHAFPVDVRFAGNEEFSVGGSTTCTNRFPQLKLIDVFDEVYFLANTIIDGVIDLRLVPIPLYLSLLRLAEVTGIKDQTHEKWKRYSAELTDLVTHSAEFDQSYGNKDIAVYNQDDFKADTVYTYIEPRTYSNIFSVNQFHPTRGPSKHLTKTAEPPGNVYEEIHKTSRPPDVIKPLTELGGELKSFFQEKNRTSVAGRPVPSIPDESHAPNNIPDKATKKTATPDLPKRHPNTIKSAVPPHIMPKPNIYMNQIPRGTVAPTAQPDQAQPQPPSSPSLPKWPPDKIQAPSSPSLSKRQPHQFQTPSSPSLARRQPDQIQTPSSPSIRKRQPDMPLATPPLSAGSVVSASPINHSGSLKDEKTFDVAALSIKDLADCMKTLKLSKYISSFQEHMVDGAILQELDVELLKSDFGFNGIEAIRLMKFAKDGHIPK